MASLKDTTITGALSVSNTANITGATQHNADVTLYAASGDSPALYFQRGTTSDTLNDYKIYDTGGYLKIKQSGNSGTSGYTQVAELTNAGKLTLSTPPATDTTPSTSAWISPTDSGIKVSGTAVTPSGTSGSADYILISDTSASGLVAKGPVFGTSTTTFLRNDGTWNAPTSLSYSGGSGAISASVTVGSSNTYLQYHNDNPGTTSSITLTASSIALSSTHVTVPTPTSDTDAATKKYVDDAVAGAGGGARGTTLMLNYISNSGWYLATLDATTTALTFNQIKAYADEGPIFIRPITATSGHYPGSIISVERIVNVEFIAADYDTSPYTVKLRLTQENGSTGEIWYEYLKLSATSLTVGMYCSTRNDTTALMTVSQLTAGTDNYDRPVSAKVIHDYITSLDATNVAY